MALETVDGGILEDITFTGVTMRDIRNALLYFRLGGRMRGPQGVPVGRLARVLIDNVTCYGPLNSYPEPWMGTLPAQHFYLRHARNVEFTNVDLASATHGRASG